MAAAAVETHKRPPVCKSQNLGTASTSDEANARTVDVDAMQRRQMPLPDALEARQLQLAEQRPRLDVVDVLELDGKDRDEPALRVGLPRQFLQARQDAVPAVAVLTRKAGRRVTSQSR
jgi:hypothetical protein